MTYFSGPTLALESEFEMFQVHNWIKTRCIFLFFSTARQIEIQFAFFSYVFQIETCFDTYFRHILR